MKIAGLDFGSNTTLLLIAEVEKGKVTQVICDETRVTKMGQGVHKSKRFHPDALARIDHALFDYRKLIDENKVTEIRAVATSAARDVENAHELFELAAKYNIPLQVIAGGAEAELTYLGAFSERKPSAFSCVIDVGGGSTELIYRDEVGEINGESIDVGSVRLMDLFGETDPMPESLYKEMRSYIQARLNPQWKKIKFQEAVAVAGTPTILASMEMKLPQFDAEKIDGFFLKKNVLEKWLSQLQKMNLAEREALPGLPPQRADVIVAGCAILLEFLDFIGLDGLEVSVRGVRYGLVLQ